MKKTVKNSAAKTVVHRKKKKMATMRGKKKDQQKKNTAAGLRPITTKLLRKLAIVLEQPSQHQTQLAGAVRVAVKAFVACVAHVGGGTSKLLDNKDGRGGRAEYAVNDEQVFDEVLRLCFQCLGKCLYLLLHPQRKPSKADRVKAAQMRRRKAPDAKRAAGKLSKHTHFKNWHRYQPLAKRYLQALHIFLLELKSNDVVVSGIRAVTDLVDLFLHFPKLSKHLIKCLIHIWSRQGSAEEARCMAFAALCKIGRLDAELFPLVYKGCYTAYVSNCKLVDEETLPSINFMQKAFTELTFVHPAMAYQYSFLFIRQFAIHLRNAMIAKRKDLVQTVYNWQFLKGLQLWTGLVCEGNRRFPEMTTATKTAKKAGGKQHQQKQNQQQPQQQQTFWFRELIHPLVECISIAERLFPSAKYLPLRIHCIRMLLTIQTGCDLFVPTLAYTIELLEELAQIDVKKPQKSKKEGVVQLEKLLRLSKDQLDDAAVRLHLAEQIFTLAQDALRVLSERERGYRLLLVPIGVKLRHFLKTCANREHVRLFTQLRSQMAIEGENG